MFLIVCSKCRSVVLYHSLFRNLVITTDFSRCTALLKNSTLVNTIYWNAKKALAVFNVILSITHNWTTALLCSSGDTQNHTCSRMRYTSQNFAVLLRGIKLKLKRINCNIGCRALWIIFLHHLIEETFPTHVFSIQDQNNYSWVNALKKKQTKTKTSCVYAEWNNMLYCPCLCLSFPPACLSCSHE